MRIQPEVRTHHLESNLGGEHVAKLFAQLSRSLPEELASDKVRVALSPGVQEIYDEVLKSLALGKGTEGSYPGRPVTDVVDSVLSSVRMVRAATTCFDRLQQARSSWMSLFSLLGYALSEEIATLADVPFLLPRTANHEGDAFEGRAALLLSNFIPRSLRPQEDVIMDDSVSEESKESLEESSEESLEESLSRRTECFDTVSSSPDTSEAESYQSYITLDIPLDAHCLPGRGKRIICVLPVIGVADEDQIQSLMISMACQRHVLGISLPVIGISLSKRSTVASVVIGWNEFEDGQFRVHLAYPSTEGSPLGFYDIADPTSALHISQFILSFHPYFVSIRDSLDNLETNDVCWRLDHTGDSHLFQDTELSLHEGIEAWLAELPHVGSRPFSHHHTSSSPTMSSVNPKSRANEKKGKSKTLSVPTQTSKPSDKKGSTSPSYYSASGFAKLHPIGGLESMAKGVETWLWDRESLRLVRLKTSIPVSELDRQVDEMVDLYNSLTDFCWPTAWKNLSGIPQGDPVHKDLRTQLFRDYEVYASDSEVPDMLDDVYQAVLNHLSILFKSVASALVCRHQAKIIGAIEGEPRSAWDDVLKAMCGPPTAAQSDSFFVERTIPLPINQAVANGSHFPAATQAKTLRDMLNNQLDTQLNIGGSTLDVVANAGHHASNNFYKIARQGYSVKAGDRIHEPCSAIVDGICCVEYAIKDPGLLVGTDDPATQKMSAALHGFPSFIKLFSNVVKEDQTCTDGKTITFNADIPDSDEKKTITFTDSHAKCFLCSHVTERLTTPSSSQSLPADDLIRVYIPYIVAEYKRPTTAAQSLHQAQMYSVACLEYLQTIGITDFPIWGIVTSGTVGMITIAWKSTKAYPRGSRPLNIIIDQAARSFDLIEPLQALHFMTSVHRVYQQRIILEAKVSALGLADIFSGEQVKSYRDWAMPPREKGSKEKKPEAPTITATQPDGSSKVV